MNTMLDRFSLPALARSISTFSSCILVSALCGLGSHTYAADNSYASEAEGSGPQIDIAKEVSALNKAISSAVQRNGLQAGSRVDDLTFLRRATLDLGGRLPTAQEIRDYLAGSSGSKRDKLIDRLVGSAAWDSHRYNQLADMLRVEGEEEGLAYVEWLKRKVADNMPYDQMARELITAKGAIWSEDNGKVGYMLRNEGMLEDHTALTVQFFLGSRIQCAQCHDHPDDYFSRKQFLEVAAFDHPIRMTEPVLLKADKHAMRDTVEKKKITGLQITKFMTTIAPGVTDKKDKNVVKKVPHDYQYRDMGVGQHIQPSPLWGRMPRVEPGVDRRDAFADWITNEQDPRFASVLANRLWKSMFGRGLVEPVDDWRPDNPPMDKSLMDALTKLVIACEYDVELIARVIARTDAYQREAVSGLGREEPAVAGPMLRRLSAEQVWDSLVALTIPDPDNRKQTQVIDLYPLYKRFEKASTDQMLKVVQDIQRSRDQVMSKGVKRDVREGVERLAAEFTRVQQGGSPEKIAKARKDYEKKYDEYLDVLANAVLTEMPHIDSLTGDWGRFPLGFVRASEVQQPAEGTHFLRVFGQSDRQITDAGNRDGGVLQSLYLMNDAVDNMVYSSNSELRKELGKFKNMAAGTEFVYVSLLQRKPNEREQKVIQTILSGSGDKYADLVWAIINSSEFLFYR